MRETLCCQFIWVVSEILKTEFSFKMLQGTNLVGISNQFVKWLITNPQSYDIFEAHMYLKNHQLVFLAIIVVRNFLAIKHYLPMYGC